MKFILIRKPKKLYVCLVLICMVLFTFSAYQIYVYANSKRLDAHRTSAFRVLRLTRQGWISYHNDIHRNERVLVVTPGVLEPLEVGFAPEVAQKMKTLGRYDQVLGISYDWSLPTSQIAPYYASFLAHLPAAHVDLEGHSYGAIQTIAALVRTQVTPQNVIFLGAPLSGTPMAERTLLTRVLLKLPGSTWEGNFGRFSQMQTNGAASDLVPGSPLLRSLMKPFANRVSEDHINLILVAGSQSPYMAKLANLYMRAFAIQCLSCSVDNDGVIPVSSALGIYQGIPISARAHVKAFPVLHADMERDPHILEYVARNLVK
jgi:pimeloyl-ACP methyl ester carboxylesterase